MWKLIFDLRYALSFFIFNKEKRQNFRTNKLYDYRKKLNVLRNICSNIKIKKIKMIKGGWNIGFIINDEFVYKIKKRFDSNYVQNIIKEKRMTDAFRNHISLQIPHIQIIESDGYIFYKYKFIPGHNLNTFSLHIIMKHREKWAQQIAKFIYDMHNTFPDKIDDLITTKGDSWGHNDICNNIIVDTKTMNIIGIIDWEYAGWDYLETEFINCTRFSSKLRKSDIDQIIRKEYEKLKHNC